MVVYLIVRSSVGRRLRFGDGSINLEEPRVAYLLARPSEGRYLCEEWQDEIGVS